MQTAKASVLGPLSVKELATLEHGLSHYGNASQKWDVISKTMLPHRPGSVLPKLYQAACDKRAASESSGAQPWLAPPSPKVVAQEGPSTDEGCPKQTGHSDHSSIAGAVSKLPSMRTCMAQCNSVLCMLDLARP